MGPSSNQEIGYVATRLLTLTQGRRLHLLAARNVLASIGIMLLAYSAFSPTGSVGGDFSYDYVTARGFLDGLDVSSATITELRGLYLPGIQGLSPYPYPNAHPPALVFSLVPLALLPFTVARTLWLGANLFLVLRVGRMLGLSDSTGLALVLWPPLFLLLLIGQYELLILFLVLIGWRAAANGWDVRAGLWLGLAASLKLYPGLFVLPFLLQRRIKLTVTAGLTFTLAEMLGSILIGGPLGLLGYLPRLLLVERAYVLPQWANSSPYGALSRLLAPEVAVPIALGLALVGLIALFRLRPEAGAVGILVTLPGVGYYCSVLALPMIVRLFRESRGPARLALFLAAGLASLASPLVVWASAAFGLASSFGAILFGLQPLGALSLLGLSFLAGRPERLVYQPTATTLTRPVRGAGRNIASDGQ
jgi:glycosyl transferase family 87